MSRYIYSYLIKMVLNFMIFITFIGISGYFFGHLITTKEIDKGCFTGYMACVIAYCVVTIFISLLNKFAKNKIVFEKGEIRYKNRVFYSNEISIKYFKPNISIEIPELIIPKTHINANNFYLTCYLSKRDIKKLKKMDFEIKEI